jgi:plastocyanin
MHRIAVTRSGYQPYRSRDIDAGAESLNKNIALTPLINGGASQVVYITSNGFEPAVVNVYAGAVIEVIKVDVDEHSAEGSQFDSGLLAPGASYKVRMSTAGSFSYGDGDASSAAATIVVAPGSRVLMPLVRC